MLLLGMIGLSRPRSLVVMFSPSAHQLDRAFRAVRSYHGLGV